MTSNNNSNPQDYCITIDDVKQAAERIEGIAHRTPVVTSSSINRLAHRNLFFKVEALQKTGSFKFRGALNAVKQELEMLGGIHNKNNEVSLSVVTHSSGNHAQALALAAKLASTAPNNNNNNNNNNHTQQQKCQVSATIVMPNNCPLVKKNAVADFGAEIVLVEPTNQARQQKADEIVKATPGATFIHPSEDPRVIAGQGTVCWELWEQMQREHNQTVLDAIIIPVGGGGLAAGNITTIRSIWGEKIKIILAEPAVLDDAKRSFDAKELLKHDPSNPLDSVADGLKTTLGPNTWPIIRDKVDDIFTVTEEQILFATKLIWERLKVCIEPSAGVGVAVALGQDFNVRYPTQDIANVGIILCGGNVDILEISKKMEAAVKSSSS